MPSQIASGSRAFTATPTHSAAIAGLSGVKEIPISPWRSSRQGERVGVRGSAENAASHAEATAELAASPHPDPLPLKEGERGQKVSFAVVESVLRTLPPARWDRP